MGKRHVGGQRKRYKDTLKSTLKAYNIPVNKWQELAQDRPAWRTAARKGSKLFEEDRLQKLDAKRLARKNRVPDPSTAENHAHPPLDYKPTCEYINTDESSSDTKDYYYYFQMSIGSWEFTSVCASRFLSSSSKGVLLQ